MGVREGVIGLLGLWCGIGLVVTASNLAGPAVRSARPGAVLPGDTGKVGLAVTTAADELATMRRLLPDPAPGDRGAPWLVALPNGIAPFIRTYIRYQLAYLEYPRRVDVVAAGEPVPARDYAGIVAAPGIVIGGAWRADGRDRGFIRYVREAP